MTLQDGDLIETTTGECDAGSSLPTFITYIFGAISLIFLITITIVSVLNNKQLQRIREKEGCCNYTYLKTLWKLFQSKRRCYYPALAQIFDQVTDYGTTVEFYLLSQQERSQESTITDDGLIAYYDYCYNVNATYLFILSVVALIVYRIASGLIIFHKNRKISRFLFHLLFDTELYVAIFTNWQSNSQEPCIPQTLLQLLEATLESAPQTIIQLYFIFQTNSLDGGSSINPLIILSVISSIVSIFWKTVSSDAILIKESHKETDEELECYESIPHDSVITYWRDRCVFALRKGERIRYKAPQEKMQDYDNQEKSARMVHVASNSLASLASLAGDDIPLPKNVSNENVLNLMKMVGPVTAANGKDDVVEYEHDFGKTMNLHCTSSKRWLSCECISLFWIVRCLFRLMDVYIRIAILLCMWIIMGGLFASIIVFIDTVMTFRLIRKEMGCQLCSMTLISSLLISFLAAKQMTSLFVYRNCMNTLLLLCMVWLVYLSPFQTFYAGTVHEYVHILIWSSVVVSVGLLPPLWSIVAQLIDDGNRSVYDGFSVTKLAESQNYQAIVELFHFGFDAEIGSLPPKSCYQIIKFCTVNIENGKEKTRNNISVNHLTQLMSRWFETSIEMRIRKTIFFEALDLIRIWHRVWFDYPNSGDEESLMVISNALFEEKIEELCQVIDRLTPLLKRDIRYYDNKMEEHNSIGGLEVSLDFNELDETNIDKIRRIMRKAHNMIDTSDMADLDVHYLSRGGGGEHDRYRHSFGKFGGFGKYAGHSADSIDIYVNPHTYDTQNGFKAGETQIIHQETAKEKKEETDTDVDTGTDIEMENTNVIGEKQVQVTENVKENNLKKVQQEAQEEAKQVNEISITFEIHDGKLVENDEIKLSRDRFVKPSQIIEIEIVKLLIDMNLFDMVLAFNHALPIDDIVMQFKAKQNEYDLVYHDNNIKTIKVDLLGSFLQEIDSILTSNLFTDIDDVNDVNDMVTDLTISWIREMNFNNNYKYNMMDKICTRAFDIKLDAMQPELNLMCRICHYCDFVTVVTFVNFNLDNIGHSEGMKQDDRKENRQAKENKDNGNSSTNINTYPIPLVSPQNLDTLQLGQLIFCSIVRDTHHVHTFGQKQIKDRNSCAILNYLFDIYRDNKGSNVNNDQLASQHIQLEIESNQEKKDLIANKEENKDKSNGLEMQAEKEAALELEFAIELGSEKTDLAIQNVSNENKNVNDASDHKNELENKSSISNAENKEEKSRQTKLDLETQNEDIRSKNTTNENVQVETDVHVDDAREYDNLWQEIEHWVDEWYPQNSTVIDIEIDSHDQSLKQRAPLCLEIALQYSTIDVICLIIDRGCWNKDKFKPIKLGFVNEIRQEKDPDETEKIIEYMKEKGVLDINDWNEAEAQRLGAIQAVLSHLKKQQADAILEKENNLGAKLKRTVRSRLPGAPKDHSNEQHMSGYDQDIQHGRVKASNLWF